MLLYKLFEALDSEVINKRIARIVEEYDESCKCYEHLWVLIDSGY